MLPVRDVISFYIFNWPLLKKAKHTIILFVSHSKILHKHCLQFLLGVKMAPRETENNICLCKILEWPTKSIMVCYGIFCSGQYGHLMKKEIKDYALHQ